MTRALSRARNRRDRVDASRDIARNISAAPRDGRAESAQRASERARRSAPCIRVLTQTLSRNFSGRQGRIYSPRYPVPFRSARKSRVLFSDAAYFSPTLVAFLLFLPFLCSPFVNETLSRLLTRNEKRVHVWFVLKNFFLILSKF